ncbi:hypothetical protein F4X90_15245, partial [Candidatus Poribacteria bacterium]|nr:hypothetical protein [Candidatus Poribacteria bacterium]
YGGEPKEGLGQDLALHLSPPRSRELIQETAAMACRNIAEIAPFKIDPPYTFEVRVLEGKSIDGYLKRGGTKIDDRTASWHSDDLRTLSI